MRSCVHKSDVNSMVGRYQMIPETFKAGVKSLGLSGHERMTPELQDRFHDFLIKKPAEETRWPISKGRATTLTVP